MFETVAVKSVEILGNHETFVQLLCEKLTVVFSSLKVWHFQSASSSSSHISSAGAVTRFTFLGSSRCLHRSISEDSNTMFNVANCSTPLSFSTLIDNTALSSREDSSSGISFCQDFLKVSSLSCSHAFDIFSTFFRMSIFLKKSKHTIFCL